MKLYEISEKYYELFKLAENNEIPDDVIKDTLESIDGEFIEKADNIASFIKNLKAQSNAINAEISSLKSRKDSKIKAAERLTKYLKNQMIFVQKSIVETPKNCIKIRINPPSVDISNEFIDWAKNHAVHFLKYKEPEADKIKLKEALKNGEKVPHAALIQTERIEIK